MSRFVGYICSPPIYEFEGWTFEFHRYTGGPWPLKKDGGLYKRAGRRFYAMIYSFSNLSDEEQDKYRVGGGCRRIESEV